MTRTRSSRALAAVLALGITTLTGVTGAAAPAGAAPPPLPAPNTHGLTLQSWQQVTASEGSNVARYVDATFTTAALFAGGPSGQRPTIDPLARPVKVRFLLPANYDPNRAAPYPVLYLLHGGAADFQQWSKADEGNIKALVADSPFDGIVVMPEGGKSGWYSDWYGETDGHFRPQWETFHIEQLVPWVDANLNTSGDRAGRVLAGVSMGGAGTLMYSGRHTDLFDAIGTFSGGTDITDPQGQTTISNSMWFYGAATYWHGLFDGNYRVNNWGTGSSLDQMSYRLQTVFGPPTVTNGVKHWPERNPIEMADRYTAYDGKLAMYAGQAGEPENGAWNTRFHERLNAAGVDHRYCTGDGTHSWEYWLGEVSDFLDYVYGTTPGTCPNGWGLQPLT